jgi:DNA-3-methyladenine glycosylase
MSSPSRLNRAFFDRPTNAVAQDLLGQRLVLLNKNKERLSGLILETEAYVGTEDLACHARVGKTKRNAAMWGPPGHVYVYFTYGVHWMLNFVTEKEGFPSAVLLRGIWPQEGVDEMLQRRPVAKFANLSNGPAKLCQALGIDGSWNDADLCSKDSKIFIERGLSIPSKLVSIGPRIGLNNVPEPWKSKPWRYFVNANIFINGETTK